MTGVADRIRQILRERGWSQRELARRAEFTTASQLSGILRNLDRDEGAVERATLQRIAQGAEVSEQWLLLGDHGASASLDAKTARHRRPPVRGDAIGFDEAFREARRRAPDIRSYAWEAVAGGLRGIVRGIATPDDVIKLARVAEELADPARTEAALALQTARVRELESTLGRRGGRGDAEQCSDDPAPTSERECGGAADVV